MIDLHGISRESFDLIVGFEVSSRAAYEKTYRRPERPGRASGITVGIGYDCGYSTEAVIRQDWAGKIPNAMVNVLDHRQHQHHFAGSRLAEVQSVKLEPDAPVAIVAASLHPIRLINA